MDYVSIPSSATRLDSAASMSDIRPAKRIVTSLPSSSPAEDHSSTTVPSYPTSGAFSILPQMLLAGSLPPGTLPSSSTGQEDGSETKLLTTREPLSLPMTSTNFRRFVARADPLFWLQDRIEEIVMWRRGWKVTSVWMAAYAFLCMYFIFRLLLRLTWLLGYFPRLIFLLPHIGLIGIILACYPYTSVPAPVSDSNVNWQANLQAIQNLMGLM
jgi:hypothetical protein